MIGTIIGNYKITQKIGEGGMGAVFKGIDLMLEREVAIKMLRPELASQPDVVERFRSEAVTLAKLNHPNIATLYSFLRQGNDFFMVMEFVQGQTLDSVIRRSGAMPVSHAVTLFCQSLEGIGRAHKLGIIHRDIKPANMMLTAEDGSIKVMDFGIARVLGTARMTRQGNIVGTIEYMSPEAIQGKEVDARADIYSLGILLYEMVTARLPFVSDTEFGMMMAQIEQAPTPPTAIAPHVPVGIERAIMRSLAKRPDARFQTAGEFREALQAGLAPSQTPTQRVSPATAATRIATNPQADALKETRLGGPQSAGTPAPNAAQLKETRLGSVGQQPQPQTPPQPYATPPQAYATPPNAYATPPNAYATPAHPYATPAQPYAATPQGSFFSRLTWVHYTGAAVLLAALVAVPMILISANNKQALTKEAPATVNKTVETAPPQSTTPPVFAPASSPAPPVKAAPQQPPGLVDTDISTGTQPREEARGKSPKPAKKKEDEDLARRRKEARKILDQ